MGNTKRDRFVRIAEARTNKLIQMIRLLGNCSNKSAYEYSTEEIKKYLLLLKKSLDQQKRSSQMNMMIDSL